MDAFELKTYRKYLGLSQGELGAAVGMTRHTVSNWEKGHRISKYAETMIKRMVDEKKSNAGALVPSSTCSDKRVAELQAELNMLQDYNDKLREYGSLGLIERALYIRRGLASALLQYCAAGYNTLQLFENAVRAVYPALCIGYNMIWDFQCFSWPEECDNDELDNLIKIERALIVLTQKPGWV